MQKVDASADLGAGGARATASWKVARLVITDEGGVRGGHMNVCVFVFVCSTYVLDL